MLAFRTVTYCTENEETPYREAVAGSAPGVLAGVLLLQWLSANVMTVLGVLLGVTIFACAITMLRPGNVLPVRSSGIWFGGFGLLSGLLGGLFSAGGPPLVYHFYRQPMAMEALRATLVAALTTMSVMRIVVVLATGQFSLLALKMILLAAPLAMHLQKACNCVSQPDQGRVLVIPRVPVHRDIESRKPDRRRADAKSEISRHHTCKNARKWGHQIAPRDDRSCAQEAAYAQNDLRVDLRAHQNTLDGG